MMIRLLGFMGVLDLVMHTIMAAMHPLVLMVEPPVLLRRLESAFFMKPLMQPMPVRQFLVEIFILVVQGMMFQVDLLMIHLIMSKRRDGN